MSGKIAPKNVKRGQKGPIKFASNVKKGFEHHNATKHPAKVIYPHTINKKTKKQHPPKKRIAQSVLRRLKLTRANAGNVYTAYRQFRMNARTRRESEQKELEQKSASAAAAASKNAMAEAAAAAINQKKFANQEARRKAEEAKEAKENGYDTESLSKGGRRRTKHHKKHRAKHHTRRRAHRRRTHRRRTHRQ